MDEAQVLERLEAWRLAKARCDEAQERYSDAVRALREAETALMQAAVAVNPDIG